MTSPPPTLHPPELALDEDVRWVLLAAFSNAGAVDRHPPASAERAARLVREFGIVGQVTSRHSRAQLLGALSSAEVDTLTRIATTWTMRGLAAARVTTEVCEVATREKIAIALLKQAALRSLGLVTPAQRHASDVDLLVRRADVAPLSEALQRHGFTLERDKEHAHGVVVLRSAEKVGVELHTSIVGLTPASGASGFDLDTLLDRQLATPHSPKSARVWLPRLEVVGAHLVWQGWGLFRYAPHAPEHKTPFRVLADLQHLGVHTNPTLRAAIRQYLPATVPEQDYQGLVELAASLALGDCEPSSEAAKLVLRHMLATRLDQRYRDSLYLVRQREALRAEGLTGWIRRQLRRALRPSNEELEHMVRVGSATSVAMARLQLPLQLATRSLRGVVESFGRSGRR